MNLANKLTMFRVIIVPFFVFFMSAEFVPLRFLWALILFALASITDMLDGKIARKYDMVTDFGKFLDPWQTKYWSRRRLSASWSWGGRMLGSRS